jgi:hypothetical protein
MSEKDKKREQENRSDFAEQARECSYRQTGYREGQRFGYANGKVVD